MLYFILGASRFCVMAKIKYGTQSGKSINGTMAQQCWSETLSPNWHTNTGKSLSEALLFAEHGGEHVKLCTKNVLNARNNFCTQHVLPRFALGIFMH